MTEAEWLACADPRALFAALPATASKRKFLLFCVQCCFFSSKELNPDTATCVFADLWRLIERFADGKADAAEVEAAWGGAGANQQEEGWPFHPRNWARNWAYRDDGLAYDLGDVEIAGLMREIFGNPIRTVTLDPLWLTFDVQALAEGIYAERAFDRMPILADALQDAGCTNEDVLSHCRDANAVHVRGCWVLDLLLGKG
jgi:hypothetical protein